MKGLDKFRSSQSLMASAMNDYNDKNIDPNVSTEKEEEVFSNFDEVVMEYEKEPRSIAVIPRKIRVIKVTTKELPIKNSREITSELEATHTDISTNKREVLEPLEHVENGGSCRRSFPSNSTQAQRGEKDGKIHNACGQ
ncbi:MAG: hypothetical protein WBI17_06965 [Clostridiaceae bacterium]